MITIAELVNMYICKFCGTAFCVVEVHNNPAISNQRFTDFWLPYIFVGADVVNFAVPGEYIA
ncbi:MAG: hypothetical protein C6Y22_02960 [Hapalosiphonaceae cyanobacterium JJU2]|nr:MAG: hypothetical protein C6Y22_02960 [Hapalosiphonaceae cyanobacterium JJU2]